MDEVVLLDGPTVAARVMISIHSLRRLVSAGEFPQPIVIGQRVRRWRACDIDQWVDEKAKAASSK